MTAPSFTVQIVSPTGRVTVWGIYPTRAAAESEAAKVRQVGLFSQVRCVGTTTAPKGTR